ncbi:MAG: carboxypeptidase-like regulatory domain-containing protein [Deltaproteobacteria bacterium]|nr:carboxypeptidase-like regulatory domain-containing protein [Deltaproteobacteria bacterium]
MAAAACGAVTSVPQAPPDPASFPAMAAPEDHGTRLRGRVRDSHTGEPVPGATVMIGEGAHAAAVISDDNGAYWIDGPGAEVTLTVYFAATAVSRTEHLAPGEAHHVVPDIFVDTRAEPESITLSGGARH